MGVAIHEEVSGSHIHVSATYLLNPRIQVERFSSWDRAAVLTLGRSNNVILTRRADTNTLRIHPQIRSETPLPLPEDISHLIVIKPINGRNATGIIIVYNWHPTHS